MGTTIRVRAGLVLAALLSTIVALPAHASEAAATAGANWLRSQVANDGTLGDETQDRGGTGMRLRGEFGHRCEAQGRVVVEQGAGHARLGAGKPRQGLVNLDFDARLAHPLLRPTLNFLFQD